MARLQREIVISAAVKHDHLVRILDGGLHDGLPWTAMVLIAGDELAARLQIHDEDTFAMVLVQVASALEALHSAGSGDGAQQTNFVHRDVKPKNIMITGSGRGVCGVLVDLGTAKALDDSKTKNLGTSPWMAPSRFGLNDERRRDTRIGLSAQEDVYALAAVGWAMLTGTPPFSKEAEEEELTFVRRVARSPRPGLPTHASEWAHRYVDRVHQSLDPTRPSRRGSAQDLAQAVAGIAWQGQAPPSIRQLLHLSEVPAEPDKGYVSIDRAARSGAGGRSTLRRRPFGLSVCAPAAPRRRRSRGRRAANRRQEEQPAGDRPDRRGASHGRTRRRRPGSLAAGTRAGQRPGRHPLGPGASR